MAVDRVGLIRVTADPRDRYDVTCMVAFVWPLALVVLLVVLFAMGASALASPSNYRSKP